MTVVSTDRLVMRWLGGGAGRMTDPADLRGRGLVFRGEGAKGGTPAQAAA